MDRIQSYCDLAPLLDAANKLNYWTDDTGVKMSVRQSGGFPIEEDNILWRPINEIAVITAKKPLNMMVNILPKGCVTVPKHTDTLEGKIKAQRWHLPLQTCPEALFWTEQDGEFHMSLGYWCGPVEYWNLHTIYNHSVDTDRIHLIVDLL